MKRFLAAGLVLLLWIGLAAAQSIPVPQGCNAPTVPSGLDANGNFTCRQLNFPLDLSFAGLYGIPTTSTTEAEVNLGPITLILDTDPGYKTDYTVEITTPIDQTPYMIGVIQKVDTGSGQTVLTILVYRGKGGGIYNQWNIKIIGGPVFSVPAVGFSSTSLIFGSDIVQGAVVTMTTQTGLLFDNSHIIVSAIDDGINYFRGISQYNSSTGAITIYITDVSGSGTFGAWTLFAQDGPPVNAAEIAVSTSSVTIGSGTKTFTIQSGQFFPIGSPVLMTALASTTNTMAGTVVNYLGTTLTVSVPSNGTNGSGTFTAWSIFISPAPTSRISLYALTGMQINDGSGSISVTRGTARDSTDTIDLTLSADITIDFTNAANVATAALAGTISSSSLAVTGSGTSFLSNSEFGGVLRGTITDLQNQFLAVWNTSYLAQPELIGTAAATAQIDYNAAATNTSLSTLTALSAGAGTAYTRGGPLFAGQLASVLYAVIVAFNPTTGVTTGFVSSFTPTGTPDLLPGYTYYRCIGVVTVTNTTGSTYTVSNIIQPLRGMPTTNGLNSTHTYTINTQGLGLFQNIPQWVDTRPIAFTEANVFLFNYGGL